MLRTLLESTQSLTYCRFWEVGLPHLFRVVEQLLTKQPSASFLMAYQYHWMLKITNLYHYRSRSVRNDAKLRETAAEAKFDWKDLAIDFAVTSPHLRLIRFTRALS